MKGTHTRARLLWSLLLSLVMAASGWSPGAIAYALEGGGDAIQPVDDPVVETQAAQEDGRRDPIEADDPAIAPVDEGGAEEQEQPVAPVTENEEEEGPQLSAQDVVYVARIVETEEDYLTLAEAVDEAKDGETVKLLGDVELGADALVVSGEKAVTLDLDGHEVSGTGSGEHFAVVQVASGADLTVKDGLRGGSGSIANESSTNYDATGVYVGPGATFNLVSGSVEVNVGYAIYNIGGTVAISGGHVVGGSVASQSGQGVISDGTLEVTGGTVFGFNNGIHCAGGTATISGEGDAAPTIESAYRTVSVAEGATFRIEGGRFSDDKGNGDGFTLPGDMVLVENKETKLWELGLQGAAASVGGVLYATLQGAASAAKNRDTVKVLKHITLGADALVVSGEKRITLDLDGHDVSGSVPGDDGAVVQVEGGAGLTVKDGKQGGSGRIMNLAEGSSCGVLVEEGATFTLESGAVESWGGSAVCARGSADVRGGSVWCEDGCGILVEDTGSLYLSGGDVYGGGYGVWSSGWTVVSGRGDSAPTVRSAEGGRSVHASAGSTFFINGGRFGDGEGNGDGFGRPGDMVLVKNEETKLYELGLPDAVASVGDVLYATLQKAANDAKDGDTVKVLADVELGTETIIVDSVVTIDLDGYEVSGTGSSDWVVLVEWGAALTVDDGSQGGSGRIVSEYSCVHVKPGATFTLESGSVEA